MDPTDLETSSRVTLRGPGDWKPWIGIIQKFATAQNVWQFIDPSKEGRLALAKPAEPTPQQIKPEAADLLDLDAEEFRRLDFLHTQYRSKLQIYRDQQKALGSIQQHIIKTIGNYYSTIADEHDVAAELALLQARVQPTDWAHEQEVLDRYYAVLKAPQRSKIEAWITSWQKVLTEARKLDLPDVQDLRPTRHFLQSVSAINLAFTDYWINKMEDEARTGQPTWKSTFPDGIKISEIFERSHKTKKAASSRAAFASFQGEDSNSSNSSPSLATAAKERRKPRCLCGEKHYYEECPYLSEAAAPNGWKPNRDIEQKVSQRLEDPEVRDKINRTIERRGKKLRQQLKGAQNSADDSKAVRGTAFAGRPTVTTQPSTFAAAAYPLRDSFLLDSGSDTHICNNRDRFVSYEPNAIEETAYAGDSQLPILGYGQIHLQLQEGGIFILNNVAHIPAFHTSVASLDLMLSKGYNWNPATGAVTSKKEVIFRTRRIYRQPVIEFNQVQPPQPATQPQLQPQLASTFSSSSEPRAEQTAEASMWHQRLGHLNQQALERLVEHTTGARIKGPIKTDCRPCSEAKATRIVSRRSPQSRAPRPFWRIHIDIFHLHPAYNSKKAALLIRDQYTSMIYAYFLDDATQRALLGALRSFESMIQRQFNLGICRIHRDNDPALRTAYDEWIKETGIEDEPTAPYTSAQNGPAERSGGVIDTKARTMQLGANLPADLWPETWAAAVYLHNRSPQQSASWKTPIQRLHQWLQSNNRDSGYEGTISQPDITHLKAYGCRAYPLTDKALKGILKKDLKTEAHAEAGYLVGYDSSNIFRIWIPSRSEVRRIRDVTFNERIFYDPKDHPSLIQQPQQLQLPQHIESDTEDEEIDQIRHTDQILPEITVDTQGLDLADSPDTSSQEEAISQKPDQQPDYQEAYPSPQPTASPAPIEPDNQQQRSQRARRPAQKILDNEAQKKAGFHIYTSSFFQGREERLHRRSLPPEPQYWKDLEGHRFEHEFKQAATIEMTSHWSRGTFEPVATDQIHSRPLPLTWVFKYKFNKHGFLIRFKARLCVRGDLQPYDSKDTYAATLAARTFRMLMAITAKFDLETRQLDAVNAFTNSYLDEIIYVMFPDGYRRRGWSLKLNRALYGLRRSPLLWQQDLSGTFKELGLEPCTEDPCVFNNSWLTVFFFVDDIVCLYRKKDQLAADRFITKLRAKYKMQDLGALRWFLGIRIVRDRPNRKLWLCQDSYIEKLATQFGVAKADTFKGNPFPTNSLQPSETQASANMIFRFQQKIGSINYIAVISRPDIAKATSKLAEFLLNPSQQHQSIADKVISYLYATRHLAIQFGGTDPSPTAGPIRATHSSSPDLKIASDAAFADDQQTRKSSQGSIICLFGGPVSWKAGKQDTVTTSSTEAELLAFTHTAKEAIATQRLFKQLDLQLDQQPTIECDNLQTIRLISRDTPRLKTALKHVDVHNCWARQAFQQGQFKVEYVPTAEMLADGLTKPLPGQKFDQFVRQLGFVDIKALITEEIESDLED